MAYGETLALQRRLQSAVIDARDARDVEGDATMHLLLVEHDPPVVTVSRRPGARRHLLADVAQLRAAGVEVVETDRGGDITYHGPGQLVVYPILDLNTLGLRLHSYMRFLEAIVIEVLAGFGIAGQRDADATGVWVGGGAGGEAGGGPSRKICAMGVRVSRWVSMHGLALNVTTNLTHFDLIVPCGLTGCAVTSIERELGSAAPPMDAVKETLVAAFEARVGARSV